MRKLAKPMYVVFVDYRERDLLAHLAGDPDVISVSAKMDVSDILFARIIPRASTGDQCTPFEDMVHVNGGPARPATWPEHEYEAVLALERKTPGDLVNSVMASSSTPQVRRWDDQKQRMQAFGALTSCQPGLVIVNYITHINNGSPIANMTEDGFHTKVLRAAVRDGFTTLFTAGCRDTARMTRKIVQWMTLDAVTATAWTRYGDIPTTISLSVKKRDNANPGTFYRSCLQAIPGISGDIANRIVERYPSFSALIHDLESEPVTAKRAATLAGIELTHAKRTKSSTGEGKFRRLGPARAKAIVKALALDE